MAYHSSFQNSAGVFVAGIIVSSLIISSGAGYAQELLSPRLAVSASPVRTAMGRSASSFPIPGVPSSKEAIFASGADLAAVIHDFNGICMIMTGKMELLLDGMLGKAAFEPYRQDINTVSGYIDTVYRLSGELQGFLQKYRRGAAPKAGSPAVEPTEAEIVQTEERLVQVQQALKLAYEGLITLVRRVARSSGAELPESDLGGLRNGLTADDFMALYSDTILFSAESPMRYLLRLMDWQFAGIQVQSDYNFLRDEYRNLLLQLANNRAELATVLTGVREVIPNNIVLFQDTINLLDEMIRSLRRPVEQVIARQDAWAMETTQVALVQQVHALSGFFMECGIALGLMMPGLPAVFLNLQSQRIVESWGRLRQRVDALNERHEQLSRERNKLILQYNEWVLRVNLLYSRIISEPLQQSPLVIMHNFAGQLSSPLGPYLSGLDELNPETPSWQFGDLFNSLGASVGNSAWTRTHVPELLKTEAVRTAFGDQWEDLCQVVQVGKYVVPAYDVLQNEEMEFDIKQVVSRCINLVKIKRVSVQGEAQLNSFPRLEIRGNLYRLFSAFYTVFKNSIEAMALNHVSQPEISVDVSVLTPDDGPHLLQQVEIHIKDNGPGFASGQIPEFVENGSVATTSKQGHGIGLRSVRQVLESIGGSIRIANRTDGSSGAEVVISIPLDTPLFLSEEMQCAAGTRPEPSAGAVNGAI